MLALLLMCGAGANAQTPEQVAQALFGAGAGVAGRYDCCSFRAPGQGTFRPGPGTNPFIGETGKLETVEEIRQSFLEVDEEVVFEDLETAYGTRLLKVAGNGFVDIYTIYKSYELEFVMTGDELTDADVQMLVDFISDMDFVAVE